MADRSRIDPSKVYLLRGQTLSDMLARDDALWGGDNFQRGPGILRRGSATGGLTLAANGSSTTPPTARAARHSYTVYDTSARTPGSPSIGVTPGNHIDGTGGATWIPTLSGTVIAPLPTPPTLPPILSIDPSATVVYFMATTNPQDGSGALPAGAITALEIDADSGGGLPNGDNTTVYQICSFITVIGPDSNGNYAVRISEGGVAGSQVYQYCAMPLFGLQ